MRRFTLFFLLSCLLFSSCGREQPLDPASLRGLPKERLQEMRQDILSRHTDGSQLSRKETSFVELIREQERRLDNAWIFGEWRERHGARLLFRDDGSVSVGARSGRYDELGVYKFITPEEPAFESVWQLVYDESGDPVVLVGRPGGQAYIYPFHDSRTSVGEQVGDLQDASDDGCYFVKVQ
ncbi:MAG: hypothetical protein IJ636_05050 [Bacteroidales bacterium]|nr:hypothetical protein [Bacteroidales bacterium]